MQNGMRRREFLKSISALGALAVLATAPGEFCYAASGSGWRQRMRPLMGSFVGLALYTEEIERADKIIDGCFDYIENLVRVLSDYEPDNDLARLRSRGALKLNNLSPDFLQLSVLAFKMHALTDGLFQPLCFSLSKLWRDAREAQSVPDKLDIKYALKQVSSSSFVQSHDEARLSGGSGFDFGGIGQGYIADCAVEYLKSHGVKLARVDCSGDIRFLGDISWQVEIEHPRKPGEILRRISIDRACAVSSSGDYRNCWFVNGKRYHHLIDPRSGLPQNITQQVTVFHRSAAIADALDTALTFLPAQKIPAIIEKFRPCQVLMVDQAGQQHWFSA